MAEWKKVVVAGSAISQLQNDSNYLVSGDSGVELTGSFKGDGSQLTGVTADVLGNSLTDGNGITDFTFDGSGAASVAVQADGSTLSVGANGVKVSDAGITATQLASSVAGNGLSGGSGTALSVNTDGTSITTSGDSLTLAGTVFSSSIDSRIDANASAIAGLDGNYATDAELSALSSSVLLVTDAIASDVAANTSKTGITSGQASAITANTAKISYNSSASTKLGTIEESADVTDTANVTAAGALMDSEVTNLADVKAFDTSDYLASSVTTISGAQASAITANTAKTGITAQQASDITANNAKISYNSDASTKLGTIEESADVTDTANVTAAGALMDSEVTNLAQVKAFDSSDYLASSTTTISGAQASAIVANTAKTGITAQQASDITANNAKVGITSGQATAISDNTADIATLEGASHAHSNKANLDQINQDLGTSDNVNFNDLVVDGNLTVSGTTTTVNTANLLVEDKFILLNSGSADPDEGGIIIDEGAGSGHAFIYDKGDTRWGFNASVAQDASTANATAHAAAVVDMQNVAHSDSSEYQKNGNIKVDAGSIFIYC